MRNSIRFAIVTLILVCGCTKKTNLIIPTRDVDYRNKSEMTLLLDPALYIGRCPEQVDEFLGKLRPLLEEIRS